MSTTTAAPPVLIDAPIPQPPPYNLLTVAVEATPGLLSDGSFDEHWRGGANIRPYPADLGGGQDPCETGTYREKDTGTETTIPTFGAVTIYVGEVCSSFGIYSWEDFQSRANRVLTAVQHHHAELQLVAGVYKTDNPFLGDLNVTAPSGAALSSTALSPPEALARLEDAVGLTARAGVIHGTPATVTAWTEHSLLEIRQGRLQTIGGTPVVRGTGYQGQKPLGGSVPSATQAWAWATGPILYRTGAEIEMTPGTMREALNRVTNEVTYFAERDLLVAWDTQLQAAVLVDRSV